MNPVAYIFRCPPGQTLSLAKMITADYGPGLVWAPSVERRRRMPRRRTIVRSEVAVIPGYMFVHAEAVRMLIGLSGRFPLGLMRRADGQPATCGLSELKELREALSPKPQPVLPAPEEIDLNAGDQVEITRGPFRGLTGRVTALDDDYVTLAADIFSGQLKITSFLLRRL